MCSWILELRVRMAGHQVPKERRKVVVVGAAQKFTPNDEHIHDVALVSTPGVAAVLLLFFITVKHEYHKTDHLIWLSAQFSSVKCVHTSMHPACSRTFHLAKPRLCPLNNLSTPGPPAPEYICA